MADDLGRATLVRNPEYERNGLKSYVRALQKYGITPTVDGPYSGRPGEVQVQYFMMFSVAIFSVMLTGRRWKTLNTTHCTLPKSVSARHRRQSN